MIRAINYALVASTLFISMQANAQNTFPSSGNVGIGTSSPNCILEIKKSTVSALGPVLRLTGGGGANAQSALDLSTSDVGSGIPGTRIVATDDGNYGASIDFESKQPGAITNALQSRLYISNNGSIGIGTTSPSYKFHTEGSGFFNGDLTLGAQTSTTGYGKKIDFGNNSNSDPMWISHYNVSSDVSELRVNISDESNTNDQFVVGYTSASNAQWYPVMMVNASGNVGIGTTDTKGYKLAVNGEAIFTKAKVKPYENWPDYVFQTNYRLRPLSDVEQYIKQHHHLPGVPSAEEVEKNGLDLGDNQATLLKKIEELTLYAIEQNKKQDVQRQEFQELSRQVKELKQENEQLKKRLQ